VVFIVAGRLETTTGIITGFTLALLYLMTPLQVLMNSVPSLTRANIAVANVHDLGLNLTRSEEQQEIPGISAAPIHEPFARLDLAGVTYSYRQEDSEDEFTLGPIDMDVRGGEMLFVTGGNGSGKTTLAKLLAGLYKPDAGIISYNGVAIDDTTRDSYRQCFSAVFSDFFLFDSLLGLDSPDLDQRAYSYLKSLRLDHKVRVQQGVLSTTELSQGQRKRLALLTACLEDRPIYFFDEWAADQDPIFKEIFYRSILPGLKARGKTIIVISHDDRYYDVPDRILHLESGRIATPLPIQAGEQEVFFR
jgi:putative pyoverdin transport system ATP-binding/permease protein